MELLGSIDNALGVRPDERNITYHLVFTEKSLIIFRLLPQSSDEAQNLAVGHETLQPTLLPDSQGKKEEAISRGKLLEERLQEHLEEGDEDFENIPFSRISRVIFSKGTMFDLPFVRFIMGNTEHKFQLVRNRLGKAGKLEEEVFRSYLKTLKAAFGEKLRIRT